MIAALHAACVRRIWRALAASLALAAGLAISAAHAQNELSPGSAIADPLSDGAAVEAPLGLDEAVRIALTAEDPSLARFDARAEALDDLAVADAQLPDPMVRGTLANFPTDTFAYDQEAMTQVQAGLRQEFPPGRTLAARGDRRRAEADVERARKELALAEITLAVRTAWLDLFYASAAERLVGESRTAVEEMIDALSASFGAGRLSAQDVLRAELELSLLEDQLTEIARSSEAARAELARYLGAAAARPLPDALPSVPAPQALESLEAALVDHPAVRVEDAEVTVAERDIAVAEQAYRPSWAIEGGYGARGGGRADLASVGVTMSVPLFTRDRQDRRRSAAVREHGAERLDRAALLLDLKADLERAHADWTRLGQRIALYQDAVIERAEQTADASLTSYANNVADFPELIRSRLAALDAELALVELRVARAKAWARLDYLAGELP